MLTSAILGELEQAKVYAEFERMPGIVQVKVAAARDLPVMDRSSELTDAFVEVNNLLQNYILNNAHHLTAASVSFIFDAIYTMHS